MLDESLINQPDHYQKGGLSTIDIYKTMGTDGEYAALTALKYISRYNTKGTPLLDIGKAIWCIEWIANNHEATYSIKNKEVAYDLWKTKVDEQILRSAIYLILDGPQHCVAVVSILRIFLAQLTELKGLDYSLKQNVLDLE